MYTFIVKRATGKIQFRTYKFDSIAEGNKFLASYGLTDRIVDTFKTK